MEKIIEIVDLARSFGEKKVLKGISLAVNKGESVVVIGQSGCGKSVLLKHINRLLRPDSGKILIHGNDINRVNSAALFDIRKRIGMLFQSAALLDSLTVAENVGLGLREGWKHSVYEIDNIVTDKLEMVGMSGTENIYPSNLSGGMRKRVGLARAIATNPEILLYDEPTTGLDPITSDLINDLMIRLRERLDVTSIAVTHDMTSAYKIADRIVMLYDGRIEYEGTPEQIKNSGNEIVDQFINGRGSGPIQVQ
ncbi:MAG: ABC transporter ATP-binding protein [candidate division Zixibacteria bacterium]|nr:ABC transporter ATP-binding protein [candidate division Zixibacteria bacterium]